MVAQCPGQDGRGGAFVDDAHPRAHRGGAPRLAPPTRVKALEDQQRKLLKLYYQTPSQFDALVDLLDSINLQTLWDAGTQAEQRVIIDELVNTITVTPEWFSVTLFGSPPVRIRYSEVGRKDSDFDGVGGGLQPLTHATAAPG